MPQLKPIILKSKNPNYFTFLKMVTKDPSSPLYKLSEEQIYPIEIIIEKCNCRMIIENKHEFPVKDEVCNHDNMFIQFIKD